MKSGTDRLRLLLPMLNGEVTSFGVDPCQPTPVKPPLLWQSTPILEGVGSAEKGTKETDGLVAVLF